MGRITLRRQHWLMPADVAKSGGEQFLLMGMDGGKIILDIKRAVLQMDVQVIGALFAERADDGSFKPVFAVVQGVKWAT